MFFYFSRKIWRRCLSTSTLKLFSTAAPFISNVSRRRSLLLTLFLFRLWRLTFVGIVKPRDFKKKLTESASCVCVLAVLQSCNSQSPIQLSISWYLRNSHCYNEVVSMDVRHPVFSLTEFYFHILNLSQTSRWGWYTFRLFNSIHFKELY